MADRIHTFTVVRFTDEEMQAIRTNPLNTTVVEQSALSRFEDGVAVWYVPLDIWQRASHGINRVATLPPEQMRAIEQAMDETQPCEDVDCERLRGRMHVWLQAQGMTTLADCPDCKQGALIQFLSRDA